MQALFGTIKNNKKKSLFVLVAILLIGIELLIYIHNVWIYPLESIVTRDVGNKYMAIILTISLLSFIILFIKEYKQLCVICWNKFQSHDKNEEHCGNCKGMMNNYLEKIKGK